MSKEYCGKHDKIHEGTCEGCVTEATQAQPTAQDPVEEEKETRRRTNKKD